MSTRSKTCTSYGLSHTGEPARIRYVGQTSVPLRRRLKSHVNQASATMRNTPVGKWIRAAREAGHKILIHCILENAQWDVSEIAVIAGVKASGTELLNVTAGGGGHRGHILSAETRAKISAALKGRKKPAGFAERQRRRMLGTKASVETRKRLSEAHTGKTPSAAARAKMSERMLGNRRASREWTTEQREQRRQLSLNQWARKRAAEAYVDFR